MRTCDECGDEMFEGFVIDGMEYCSEECRDKNIEVPYEELYELDPDSYYWTAWEEDE